MTNKPTIIIGDSIDFTKHDLTNRYYLFKCDRYEPHGDIDDLYFTSNDIDEIKEKILEASTNKNIYGETYYSWRECVILYDTEENKKIHWSFIYND